MIRRCQFSLIDLPGEEGHLHRLPRKRDGTIYHRDPTALPEFQLQPFGGAPPKKYPRRVCGSLGLLLAVSANKRVRVYYVISYFVSVVQLTRLVTSSGERSRVFEKALWRRGPLCGF